MTFDHCEWYEHNVKYEDGVDVVLTPDQRRCLETLCVMDNIYNINTYRPLSAGIAMTPWSVSCLLRGSISTYDCSRLTSLVLAAHRNSVRVEISPYLAHLDEGRTTRIQDSLRKDFESDFGYEPDPEPLTCIEIRLHARSGESGTHWSQFHPSIQEVLEKQ